MKDLIRSLRRLSITTTPPTGGVAQVLASLAVVALFAGTACADLVLETETAQLGKQGTFATSAGVQIEKDKSGNTTVFTLNQFEYAVTDRFELLIEPFFFEKSWTGHGKSTQGLGDLEITPSYMIVEDKDDFPAIVLAFKIKVPTATNREIGTGQYDYNPFIIIGKVVGPWVFNFNLGYDFITRTKDDDLHNQLLADASAEYVIREDWSVFAEVFTNTSPIAGERGTVSAALATEYHLNKQSNVFISVGYDSDRLANVRFGFNLEW
jgi:hypothetical protein